MNKRVLGRTGLEVTELALGGLFVSKHGSEHEEGVAAIRRAVELGINYIDTAPGYLDSEAVIGDAIRDLDVPLIVSTKLGYMPEPFEPLNKEFLRGSVENSRRLLGREVLDLLMIHEPDRPDYFDWWVDKQHYTGPVSELLEELKAEGVIRFTGLGGTTAYAMPPVIRTGRFDVLLTAFQYSLLWREAEWEVLPAAQEQGMGIIIGSPLQQGGLSARFEEDVNHGAPWLSLPRRRQYQALYRFLDEIELPVTEVALRFVISNPNIATVLMGARSVEQVERNVEAVEKGPLPEEMLKRLQEIADMVPFRPYLEPFGLPFVKEFQ